MAARSSPAAPQTSTWPLSSSGQCSMTSVPPRSTAAWRRRATQPARLAAQRLLQCAQVDNAHTHLGKTRERNLLRFGFLLRAAQKFLAGHQRQRGLQNRDVAVFRLKPRGEIGNALPCLLRLFPARQRAPPRQQASCRSSSMQRSMTRCDPPNSIHNSASGALQACGRITQQRRCRRDRAAPAAAHRAASAECSGASPAQCPACRPAW